MTHTIVKYLLASLGGFLVTFFEILRSFPSPSDNNSQSISTEDFLIAIKSWWSVTLLLMNALAGLATYVLIVDLNILELNNLLSPENIPQKLLSNDFVMAFLIGTSFQVIAKSKFTLYRSKVYNSDEDKKIEISTPWDKWYETLELVFYERITARLNEKKKVKSIQETGKALELEGKYTIEQMKKYISAFIYHYDYLDKNSLSDDDTSETLAGIIVEHGLDKSFREWADKQALTSNVL